MKITDIQGCYCHILHSFQKFSGLRGSGGWSNKNRKKAEVRWSLLSSWEKNDFSATSVPLFIHSEGWCHGAPLHLATCLLGLPPAPDVLSWAACSHGSPGVLFVLGTRLAPVLHMWMVSSLSPHITSLYLLFNSYILRTYQYLRYLQW